MYHSCQAHLAQKGSHPSWGNLEALAGRFGTTPCGYEEVRYKTGGDTANLSLRDRRPSWGNLGPTKDGATPGAARRLGGPSPRRGRRSSGRARPFLPSSTEDDDVFDGCPFFYDFGLLAASRAVACAPLDPRLHLPRTVSLSGGYITFGPGLGARESATSRG